MAFNFPNNPVEGQVFQSPGGPQYKFQSAAWNILGAASGVTTPDGDSYWYDRESFVFAVASGMPIYDRKLYSVGGYTYIGKLGSTAIPDLPNLIPLPPVHVEHFGAVADMEWKLAKFATTETGQPAGPVGDTHKYYLGPLRLSGRNNLAAFMACDDYVTNAVDLGDPTNIGKWRQRNGEFFMNGSIPGKPSSGYYIEGQFILQSTMRATTEFRNSLWLNNSNVYHSNIWINSVNGGVFGVNIIPQYSFEGAKPGSNGQMGSGITICAAANEFGGPAIGVKLSPAGSRPGNVDFQSIPLITNVHLDVRFCRAGNGTPDPGQGNDTFQSSRSNALMCGAGGIEYAKYKLGIFSQTNVNSNCLGFCHWNFQYDGSAGGNAFDNYSACIPTETYHACHIEVEIPQFIDMREQYHGLSNLWEFASCGMSSIGPTATRGTFPVAVTPGDAINYYTNPAQKEKIMKGIRIGYITAIDIPLKSSEGINNANGAGANVYTRGFGTSKWDVDIYETTTTRNICRQLECDIQYDGMMLVRTGTTPEKIAAGGLAPNWNGRGFYAQGVQGSLKTGPITTFGIGRGFEIEYCDGDQEIQYVDGDGCLLYEFSRGGRLLQTDTNRIVSGYVENPNDGGFRPGSGPGTRAISVGGGSYQTTVNATGAQVNNMTKTYIVPFPGADDDVYRGTPLTFKSADGLTTIATVTATEFIQGRSGGGLLEPGTAIQGMSNEAQCVINCVGHGFPVGSDVSISGMTNMNGMLLANGTSGVNGKIAQVVAVISPDAFRWDFNTTALTEYERGGFATQTFMAHKITNITAANPAVFTSVKHTFEGGEYVTIGSVVGCNVVATGLSGINGKSGKVVRIDADKFSLTGVNSASLTPYVSGGLATQNLEGVGYLEHTPLATPAVNGQIVVVEEACRLKQLSVSSRGGESALRLTNSSADNLDMHGLRSAGKYGAVLSNARASIRGPLPMTVGNRPVLGPKNITGITKASRAVITCPAHGLPDRSTVIIAGVVGMTQINGKTTTMTVIDANSFSVSVNSTAYSTYTSGGTVTETLNYTIIGDPKCLVSISDGTIAVNPRVAFHLKTSKDALTAMSGRYDLRNCRIENINKLMEGNDSGLRFNLSMYGCTDTEKNQLLSHPARQGIDATSTGYVGPVGGKGYYHFGEDGICQCWLRNVQTLADGSYPWIFPIAFNGGAATVVVRVQSREALPANVKKFGVHTQDSVGCIIQCETAVVTAFDAHAVGRWFPDIVQ